MLSGITLLLEFGLLAYIKSSGVLDIGNAMAIALIILFSVSFMSGSPVLGQFSLEWKARKSRLHIIRCFFDDFFKSFSKKFSFLSKKREKLPPKRLQAANRRCRIGKTFASRSFVLIY